MKDLNFIPTVKQVIWNRIGDHPEHVAKHSENGGGNAYFGRWGCPKLAKFTQ